MLLEEALALALSHAAKTEQRIVELREKELVEGTSGLAKVARSDIAHLERSLIEIEMYVQTLRKRLAEDTRDPLAAP
jgi:hypothetical protein